MKLKIKFLPVLLVMLLALNLVLGGVYFYLTQNKQKEPSELFKKQQLVPQKPEIVFQSHFKNLEIKFKKKDVVKFLEDTKFWKNYLVVDLVTLKEYNPKKIEIVFYEETDFENLPLVERFRIGSKVIYGYEIVQNNGQYKLNFYFNPDYINSLTKEDLDYSLNAPLIKSLVRLATLHQKKNRLTREEEKLVLKKAVEYLKKIKLVYVEKK